MKRLLAALLLMTAAQSAVAGVPTPPPAASLADWANSFDPAAPGLLAADTLLDAPAGGRGTIVVRDGHFYSGDRRVRLWGMNLAFGANFPTHQQADQVAQRLARFGINAVRLHHMDMQPFPNGIWADKTLTTLSPEALDRLDYFTAALKARGIWSDINLHVSRNYASLHAETRNSKTPIDKIVDLFDPVLIDSQKKYAHDLLTHVNAYTHNRYADEPSVAIVEINNENSLFMWKAREQLAALPAPFAGELQELWNRWLLDRYHSRDGLSKAWSVGAATLGEQMLADAEFSEPDSKSPWHAEMHEEAKMSCDRDHGSATLNITHVDSTTWHLQFSQPNLRLIAGRPYTIRFNAQSPKPVKINVSVGQAHEPWDNLGFDEPVMLTTREQPYSFTFIAQHDEDNARLSFIVGAAETSIQISKPFMSTGGVSGLNADEDPATATVAMPGLSHSSTPVRQDDWYQFLEETEAKYYQSMFEYLHRDLGVKCPVTGTIAFGLLPLKAQLGMDYIDTHAYWDHPHFPHRQWDSSDWLIQNLPMGDSPEHNALFSLAGYRVAGKPFTVTEYNHAAPNEWQAECVPMIASYAAAQDWDGVFLFAYSHSADFDKPIMRDFFNFEGNPLKMPLIPMGARLFLGGDVHPLAPSVPRDIRFDGDLGTKSGVADSQSLVHAISIGIANSPPTTARSANPPTIRWTSNGPATGTGRYTVVDSDSIVFVGFATGEMPIDLGMLSIQSMSTPFATMVLTADNGQQPLRDAHRLLLTTVARAANTDMKWNAARTSVGKQWGNLPEQIERVVAILRLQGHWSHAQALDPSGEPVGDNLVHSVGNDTELQLGTTPAEAYVIDR